MNLNEVLQMGRKKNASDVHFKEGSRPVFRIDGELVFVDHPPLSHEDLMKIVAQLLMLDEAHREMFERNKEIDIGYSLEGVGRFRVNFSHQQGNLAIALRRVYEPEELDFNRLHLPEVVRRLSLQHRGLILVTGITGSGKTTTLATMLNCINAHRSCHIVTVEDPIEILLKEKKALIDQREIITDTANFNAALRNVVRQDPDVILIGEMRDADSVSAALRIAEAGHLVLSSLHTTNASETINRIISFYPLAEARVICALLAGALRAIISQRLLPLFKEKGRVPALEVMICTERIKDLIRQGKMEEMPAVIEKGGEYGMRTFDQSLLELFKNKLISLEVAMEASTSPNDLRLSMQKEGLL